MMRQYSNNRYQQYHSHGSITIVDLWYVIFFLDDILETIE